MSYANRGAGLERLIEAANQQFLARGEAVVQKVATPTAPIRRRGETVIVRRKSTVDFVGVVDPGIPVAFDAKETAVDRWPLAQIESHQLGFLSEWAGRGGVAFLIVEFTRLGRIFYLPAAVLEDKYVARAMDGGRKSIALSEFEEDGVELARGKGGLILDYVSVVRQERESQVA